MKSQEYVLIIDEIKLILKARKINYRQLSELTSYSTSSLKKIFSYHSTSLEKIIHICESLDISLIDVCEMVKRREGKVFSLTFEQEEFFSKNLKYYLFFDMIYREKLSSNKAKEILKLDDNLHRKIIIKLEEFDLLVSTDGLLKFKIQGGIKFIKDGPLLEKVLEKSITYFSRYLILEKETIGPPANPFMRFNFSYISKKTYIELIESLKVVHTEFANRSIRDRNLYPKEDLYSVSWLLGVGTVNALYESLIDK